MAENRDGDTGAALASLKIVCRKHVLPFETFRDCIIEGMVYRKKEASGFAERY